VGDLTRAQSEEFDQIGLTRRITKNEYARLVSRTHAEHLDFITKQEVSRNVLGNTEFLVTGCFKEFLCYIRMMGMIRGM